MIICLFVCLYSGRDGHFPGRTTCTWRVYLLTTGKILFVCLFACLFVCWLVYLFIYCSCSLIFIT